MINQVLQELLESFFKYKMQEIWTACPCVILTIHDDLFDQRVDVQPILARRYDNGDDQEYPPILSVPVVFQSSSTSGMTYPVNVGDAVLCVFSKVGTDTFRAAEDNDITIPVDFRSFDYRDAVAIPGLFSFAQAINNPEKYTLSHDTRDLNITHNIGSGQEARVKLGADGSIFLENTKGIISLDASGEILIESGDSKIELGLVGVNIEGLTVKINGVDFSPHTHTSTAPGSPTSPPLPTP